LRGNLAALAPALEGFVAFEEYPSKPGFHTLNGFMFTMLGLYDWSRSLAGGSSSARAEQAFREAMATLVYTLPYFEVGGFSAYDLGHVMRDVAPNLQAWYHAYHIALLHALDSVAPQLSLRQYEETWRADVP
jgi:hypothetical protein